MFYWGLLIGLIIGANIGLVVAGLLSRSKRDEQAAMWAQEICGWVDTRPIKPNLSSFKPRARPYPSE